MLLKFLFLLWIFLNISKCNIVDEWLIKIDTSVNVFSQINLNNFDFIVDKIDRKTIKYSKRFVDVVDLEKALNSIEFVNLVDRQILVDQKLINKNECVLKCYLDQHIPNCLMKCKSEYQNTTSLCENDLDELIREHNLEKKSDYLLKNDLSIDVLVANSPTTSFSSINRKEPSDSFLFMLKRIFFLSNKIDINSNNEENEILNDYQNKEVILNDENLNINEHNDEKDVYLDDDSIQQQMPDGMSILEVVEYVKTIGKTGLFKEYKLIKLEPLVSSIDAFNDASNFDKNRYSDVPCLDDTRVKLIKNDDLDEERSFSDYIHANYVDGYKQKNAYIGSQGPLDNTRDDFWKMVWQEKVAVIVMTTKCIEQRRVKCAQYWPNKENYKFKFGLLEIENKNIEDKTDFIISKLLVRNLLSREEREVIHCQFLSWPDHGVPKSPNQMLEFVRLVRHYQKNLTFNLVNSNKWHGHRLGPPILVHCSAGIGRTGTFFTIDININCLLDTKKINIRETVSKIRSQRALSVQMPDQYAFCYMAIIEYAIQENILSPEINLTKIFI